MKKTIILTSLFTLLLSACSSSPTEPVKNKATQYLCDDDKQLLIEPLNDGDDFIVVIIPPKDKHHSETSYYLQSVAAASGSKYSDGIYSWWEKGNEAIFAADDTPLMTHCKKQ